MPTRTVKKSAARTKPARTKPARTKPAKSKAPRTVADYIASAPKEQRAALTRLRRTINAAAPTATEGIGYGMAAFKHKGKPVIHFAHWRTHIAVYGDFPAHAAELKAYDQSGKGTYRFSADKPLPYVLVTKIVKARIAEIGRPG
jgi:uncharacterized protein YdhG (YjbR/CyaY superfamily)